VRSALVSTRLAGPDDSARVSVSREARVPFFAQAKGNPYLNDLFWVIYDRLAMFTQIGAFSLASAAKGGIHLGRVTCGQRVRYWRCAAAVFRGAATAKSVAAPVRGAATDLAVGAQ
jgi:hypothetical protein